MFHDGFYQVHATQKDHADSRDPGHLCRYLCVLHRSGPYENIHVTVGMGPRNEEARDCQEKWRNFIIATYIVASFSFASLHIEKHSRGRNLELEEDNIRLGTSSYHLFTQPHKISPLCVPREHRFGSRFPMERKRSLKKNES